MKNQTTEMLRHCFRQRGPMATGLLACIGTLGLVLAPSLSDAAIIGGAGVGDITFHSNYFLDGDITPDYTTHPTSIPQSSGALTHEVWAPSGLVHAYMGMSWDFSPSQPDVFIPGPPLFGTTRLELVPSPPVPEHHGATMTGSFSILYTLDSDGLPTTTIPAQTYQVTSYINDAPWSPSGAGFTAHWDYTDVGFGLLGSQDISYSAPAGFGVVSTVSSLPLTLAVPAGHTTLEVSGDFMLWAESDDEFFAGLPPFDTMISVAPVPEPGTLVLLSMAALGLLTYAWGRRRRELVR